MAWFRARGCWSAGISSKPAIAAACMQQTELSIAQPRFYVLCKGSNLQLGARARRILRIRDTHVASRSTAVEWWTFPSPTLSALNVQIFSTGFCRGSAVTDSCQTSDGPRSVPGGGMNGPDSRPDPRTVRTVPAASRRHADRCQVVSALSQESAGLSHSSFTDREDEHRGRVRRGHHHLRAR